MGYEMHHKSLPRKKEVKKKKKQTPLIQRKASMFEITNKQRICGTKNGK